MKKIALILSMILVFTMLFALSAPAFADDDVAAAQTETQTEEPEKDNPTSTKAVAAAVVVAVVAAVGAAGMALAIAKSVGSMARQPEAAGKINSAMMLGLVFIETAIIYALIVAILIIFVL